MKAREELRRGVRAARAGRGPEARAAFRAVLREDPLNETALLWLAYLDDNARASLAYIARVLEAYPRSPRAHAALRWARRRVRVTAPAPPVARGDASPPLEPPRRRREVYRAAVGLAALGALILLTALVGWAVGLPARAESVPLAPASPSPPPPTPTDLPLSAMLSPTASSTFTPSPTPLPPSPTQPPTATPTPTATQPPTLVPVLPTPLPTPVPLSTMGEGRWIDVDLTRQVLVAYENSTPVRTVAVSTGLPYTPTPVGQFRIYVKYVYDDMTGPGYNLPNVPYVMYFHAGYSLHGTYWHSNFGHPMSHGCVNLPTPEAQWLFNWAGVGTLVNIHY